MPVRTRQKGGQQIWYKKNRVEKFKTWGLQFIVLLLFVIAARFIHGQTIWAFVADAPDQAYDMASRMMPPNWGYGYRLLGPLLDTIHIATLGTFIAIIVAVPVAFMAARNTTPHPIARQIAMVIIVFSRSVNTMVWALVLVTIVGPGIFAGLLAIGLRAVGFISKLLYEAIEEINHEAVEAISATGATRGQILMYSVVPQILPAFAGITIFRWDVNIRESTVVGLVGAGGIGLYLDATIARLAWANTSVVLAMILVLVVFGEWVSAKVRASIT